MTLKPTICLTYMGIQLQNYPLQYSNVPQHTPTDTGFLNRRPGTPVPLNRLP